MTLTIRDIPLIVTAETDDDGCNYEIVKVETASGDDITALFEWGFSKPMIVEELESEIRQYARDEMRQAEWDRSADALLDKLNGCF